jgi:GT2 family glycosyltransferase
LSVIFPTRNRADLLAAALEALTKQTLPSEAFEILVVDNDSSDQTPAVAERYAARLGNLAYLRVPELGLHSGRHAGLRAARGGVLVYADDDIEACPSWLESIAEAFVDPEVALVGGNNLPAFVKPPPRWLLRMWEQSASMGGHAIPPLSVLELPGPERDMSPSWVWGCNFSIRREVLLAAGGFHPDGMPTQLLHMRGDGESHVSRQVRERGLRCRFHPGASVYHKVTPDRMTFAYFRERGFRQGISDSYTALRAGRPPRRVGPTVRRVLQWGLWQVRGMLASDPEMHQAQLALVAGLAAGYAHHQHLYRTSAELRDWVHKPTYL